jgi:hypothetical protein
MATCEALERLEVQTRDAVALLEQPLLVATLQQLTAVELERLPVPPLGQRAFKLVDIEPQRHIHAPLNGAWRDVDQAIGVRQHPT